MRRQDEIIRAWAESFPAGDYREDGRTVDARGPILTGAWRSPDLAEYLPRGRGRSRPVFLVTGDRWGSPGWGHANPQDETRRTVEEVARSTDADVLLVPFAALESAGIVRSSIRPLEIRPDARWKEYEDVPESVADVGKAIRLPWGTSRANGNRAGEGYTLQWRPGDGHTYTREVSTHRVEYRERPEDSGASWPRRERVLVPLDEERIGALERGWNSCEQDPDVPGRYRTILHMHRLGDSIFTAVVRGNRTSRRECSVADVIRAYLDEDLDALDTDAPIRETVPTLRRRRFVSSFDMQESRWGGLYFLATLPGSSRARSVETAIEDLAPAAVHAALARGRTVYRQGDIFAVATDLSDADVYGFARTRARLTLWTRQAAARPGEIGYRAPMSDATWRRIYRDTRRTVATSIGALLNTPGPEGKRGVRANRYPYYGNGRDHYRGNGRALLDLSADTFGRAHARHVRPTRDLRADLQSALSVHGTAHSATEVVKGPGGTVYLRGIMRHVPGLEPGRRGGRDHVDLHLGDRQTWFLAIRNTVPRGTLDTTRSRV